MQNITDGSDLNLLPDELDGILAALRQINEITPGMAALELLNESALQTSADAAERHIQYWARQHAIIQALLTAQALSSSTPAREEELMFEGHQNWSSALDLSQEAWMKWDDRFVSVQDEIENREFGVIQDIAVGAMSTVQRTMASMNLSASSTVAGVVALRKLVTTASLRSRLETFLATPPHYFSASMDVHQLRVTEGHQQDIRNRTANFCSQLWMKPCWERTS